MTGAKPDISPLAVLLLALLFFLDESNLLFYFLAAAVLHECGHFLALYLLGGRASALRIGVLGAHIKLSGAKMLSYKAEIAVALAGPASNLALALIFAPLGAFFETELFYTFSGVNLCLMALNLMPAKALDGGRALYFAMLYFWGQRAAEVVSFALTLTCCFLMVLFGLWIFYVTEHNYTMLAIGIAAGIGVFIKSESG